MAIDYAPMGIRVYNISAYGDLQLGDLVDVLGSEMAGVKVCLRVPRLAVEAMALKFGSLRFLLSGARIDASRAKREIMFEPNYDLRSLVREIMQDLASPSLQDGL
jgi:nucleoside-diphosphate-sugar epimerase